MSGSDGASVCGFRHDSGGMGRAINMTSVDSPGGPVVKNSPVSAGDMGSILGLGRSTCLKATRPVDNYRASFPSSSWCLATRA